MKYWISAAILGTLFCAQAFAEADKPNVVLLFIDDLREEPVAFQRLFVLEKLQLVGERLVAGDLTQSGANLRLAQHIRS